MGRRKRSKNKSSKNTSKTLSLVTRSLEWIWDLERLWFFWIVSCIDCTSSCIEWDVWKTRMLGVVVVGGIYSPNHQFNRWGGCLSMGAPGSPVRHRTVRCASHVTQPLWFWRFRPLELWQLGAPDSHCSLSGAPSGAALTLRALFTFAGDRWSQPLCWEPLLCLVHRTVRERLSRNPKVKSWSRSPWCTGHCPVRQTRVLFGYFCSFLLNPNLIFLLVCVEPLAP
jgi:hypothetical protein